MSGTVSWYCVHPAKSHSHCAKCNSSLTKGQSINFLWYHNAHCTEKISQQTQLTDRTSCALYSTHEYSSSDNTHTGRTPF